MMTMTRDTTVAVVATCPETVLADYVRLLDLAGLSLPVDVAGERAWSLMPATPAGPAGPAAACPPWQLEGVVRALLSAGHAATNIALAIPNPAGGDHPVVRSWRRALAGCDVDDTPVAPAELRGDSSRLLLANLRTHRSLGLLGAVAAWAGSETADLESLDLPLAAPLLEKAWESSAETLAGAVVDATIVGDGRHDAALMPVAAHLLLAGRDPVAVDAVACRLAGLDPRTVPLVATLAAANLGCADLAAIDLVGDTLELPASLDLVAARGFRGHRSSSGPRWWRRWNAQLSGRWPRPLVRRRARRRYETQAWGRLHQEYDRRGFIGGEES